MTADRSFLGSGYDDILRTNDRRDQRALLDVVDACKFASAEACAQFAGHNAVENVTLSDKVSYERIFRLIVNIFRRTDLLDAAFRHDNNRVGHSQGFFLIMSDINESDTQVSVHLLEFELHFLSHLKVKSSQRFIEEKNLRLIDQRPCDRDTLLLAAGQGGDGSLLKSFEIDKVKDLFHFFRYDILRHLLLTKAESYIFINIHMREERIPLKDRVDRTFIRRQGGNILTVKENSA